MAKLIDSQLVRLLRILKQQFTIVLQATRRTMAQKKKYVYKVVYTKRCFLLLLLTFSL